MGKLFLLLVGRSFGKSLSCSASVLPRQLATCLAQAGMADASRGEHGFGRARRQSNPSQEKREKSKPVQAHFVVSKNMFLG
jgi:hypothetical protein